MPHQEKDVGNIEMIGRMLDAAGRTAGNYDPDQLVRLVALRGRLAAAERQAVAGMRRAGVTWTRIGEALGVTRQAVIQTYGPDEALSRLPPS